MNRNRTDSPMGVVAENHLAYVPTSHHPMSIVYQPNALELASRRQEFRDLIGAIAQNLRPFARTPRERSVCDDVRRGRSLSLEGLEILCELAARSEKPFVLEEAIRGQVLRSITAAPSLNVVDTWLDEGRKQRAADDAHDQFIVERLPTRRDAALDRLVPHWHALRTAIDALHCWPNRSTA